MPAPQNGNATSAPPPPDGNISPQDESTQPPANDPSQCLVSVEIAECGPLLQGTKLDPNCPCHNFCGSIYLGCCNDASDCPLECEPLLGEKFVAGCVLAESQLPSGEIVTPPGSTPAPTNTTEAPMSAPPNAPIEPGQECLVTSNEEECFALLEEVGPRDDGYNCRNFCSGVELDCCPSGEDCPPLECNGDFVAGCRDMGEHTISSQPSPAPTPAPKCYVSVNTQLCEQLTFTQTPNPNCDCYNYCDGQYAGCSGYDEFESVQCEGDLVAGCEIDPEPRCLVSVNTGECGRLMEELPDEYLESEKGCSCFQFCGNDYAGCCGFDEFCGFKCAGPFSVIGCTVEDLPDETKRKLKPFMQQTVVPVGGFYAPGLWPSSFFVDGAAGSGNTKG